jgi:hypothetical protein
MKTSVNNNFDKKINKKYQKYEKLAFFVYI